MTVIELMEMLNKCKSDFEVRYGGNDDTITIVIEHKSISSPDESYVEIY